MIEKLIQKQVNDIFYKKFTELFNTTTTQYNRRKMLVEIPPLFEFARDILKFDRLTEGIHQGWCNKLQKRFNRRLFLKPRGTFKSTIYTRAYPIWKLIQNPSLRILIGSDTYENATLFLENIKKIVLFNQWFANHGITKGSAWKVDGADLNIKDSNGVHKEYNLTACSVGSNIVGKHFDLIILDDIVNNDDRESHSIREKKKRWIQDLPSIMESEDSQVIVVGTRWHFDDLYNYLIDELDWDYEIETPYNDDGSLRFEYDNNGEPLLNKDVLDNKRKQLGEIHFSAQYMNNPLPEGIAIFRKEMLHFYDRREIDSSTLTFYGYCDLSLGRTAQSDYTAIIILGKSQVDNKYYIWDCIVRRQPPDTTLDLILSLDDKYSFNVFGIEDNQFQTLVKDKLRLKLKDEAKHLWIKGIHNKRNKDARIAGIQPYISDGDVLFPKDYIKNNDFRLLVDQLLYFGATTHDDAPDALEGCLGICQKYGEVRAIG